MNDSKCKNRITGRIQSYCPQLISRNESGACHSNDEIGEVCYTWKLAEEVAKRKLALPKINAHNFKLETKHIIDYLLKTQKLLSIEDNPVSMKTLEKTLKPFSDDMYKAPNGQVGLELIKEHQDIGLVLLDLDMPIMDGMEFLEELNKELPPEERSFPILIVSEFKKWENAKKAISLGVLGYIKKPYSAVQILEKVRDILILFAEEHPQLV